MRRLASKALQWIALQIVNHVTTLPWTIIAFIVFARLVEMTWWLCLLLAFPFYLAWNWGWFLVVVLCAHGGLCLRAGAEVRSPP